MRIALVVDTFPPLRSSGAVQLRDLAQEFGRQGHSLCVLVASPALERNWLVDDMEGVEILRLRTPRMKDVGYVRRTLAEAMMPFCMLWQLRRTPQWTAGWEGVVWYSPSIFLGPVVRFLRSRGVGNRAARTYLIIRDIFPEWAADMGLMRRGVPYLLFRAVARYQYSLADVIGIQTEGNRVYFERESGTSGKRVEVLPNWLAPASDRGCSVRIDALPICGRKVLVYAGNMGVAQGTDVLLDLATRMQPRKDLGFLFVGRGSDAARLRAKASSLHLDNVVFLDEIDAEEIPGLYAQCHVGLVALDPRHRSHNIPGKFVSYMHAGLPVLAVVNPGNDLVALVREEEVGQVCTSRDMADLEASAVAVAQAAELDPHIRGRCRALAARMFSVTSAVRQVLEGLTAPAAVEPGEPGESAGRASARRHICAGRNAADEPACGVQPETRRE